MTSSGGGGVHYPDCWIIFCISDVRFMNILLLMFTVYAIWCGLYAISMLNQTPTRFVTSYIHWPLDIKSFKNLSLVWQEFSFQVGFLTGMNGKRDSPFGYGGGGVQRASGNDHLVFRRAWKITVDSNYFHINVWLKTFLVYTHHKLTFGMKRQL